MINLIHMLDLSTIGTQRVGDHTNLMFKKGLEGRGLFEKYLIMWWMYYPHFMIWSEVGEEVNTL